MNRNRFTVDLQPTFSYPEESIEESMIDNNMVNPNNIPEVEAGQSAVDIPTHL